MHRAHEGADERSPEGPRQRHGTRDEERRQETHGNIGEAQRGRRGKMDELIFLERAKEISTRGDSEQNQVSRKVSANAPRFDLFPSERKKEILKESEPKLGGQGGSEPEASITGVGHETAQEQRQGGRLRGYHRWDRRGFAWTHEETRTAEGTTGTITSAWRISIKSSSILLL